MEIAKRLYIVSFGDSAKYRVEYPGTKEDLENSSELKNVEDTLVEYIKDKLPVCKHIKRLITPAVHEVEPEDADRYNDYLELNAESIEHLKKLVLTEAHNYQDQKQMDSNAPFDNIN